MVSGCANSFQAFWANRITVASENSVVGENIFTLVNQSLCFFNPFLTARAIVIFFVWAYAFKT